MASAGADARDKSPTRNSQGFKWYPNSSNKFWTETEHFFYTRKCGLLGLQT